MKRSWMKRRVTVDPAWPACKKLVWERAKGRSEYSGQPGTDFHHVVKRSQGGKHDPANVVLLTRAEHAATDNAFAVGRLVVTPLGGGKFHFEVVTKAAKWV